MSPSLASAATKAGIVLFLAGMKAGVLQADDVAVLHRRHRAFGGVADAVVDEFDRPLDDVRDLGGDRLERIFLVAALRAAEMREQDHLGALVGDFGDGVRHALDAGGVGDHAVLHRHVEVGAHQHALALHVGVVEGAERAHGWLRRERFQISLPIATAVSAMRLEKPHSLSYHDITRTNVPSITLVWSMWKIEECGSWLKSIETLGASV